MFYYVLRRLATVVVMLFLITATTFALFFASPIDPARYTCGKNCTPIILEGNRKALGYDQPAIVQYGKFIQGLFVGREFPDNAELRAAVPRADRGLPRALPRLFTQPAPHHQRDGRRGLAHLTVHRHRRLHPLDADRCRRRRRSRR